MFRTLHDECESGNVEEAQQMILNGANVNMTNNDNFGDVSHSFYCCKQDDNNDDY